MGLNGVGKTTLIKTILGLKDYDSGSVLINGQKHKNILARKFLSYLPERFDPPWFLSGEEFLRFSMKMYNIPFQADVMNAYASSLALHPDVLKNRVQTYSKGMRQKLGILATVLSQSGLLILDEPMSGLDPKARTMVKDLLMKIKQEGRTVFLSSHILSDMGELCDRVAILSNKKFVFSGTPDELSSKTKHQNLERAFMSIIEVEEP